MQRRSKYKPSLSELRISLKRRGKEYLLENSLHGVPYFVDPSRPLYERIIWFILTLGSMTAAMAVIVALWGKFEKEPTITSINPTMSDMSFHFPTVFLCFDWKSFRQTDLSEVSRKHFEAVYNYNTKFEINSAGVNLSSIGSYSSFFYERAPDCSEAFTNCGFQNENSTSCGNILEKVLSAIGICCVFHSKLLSADNVFWGLEFSINTYPISAHIIDRLDIVPNVLDIPNHVFLNPDEYYFTTKATLTNEGLRTLWKKERNCIYPDEGDPYNLCQEKCMKRNILKSCSCLPWFLMDSIDEAPSHQVSECKWQDYNDCLNREIPKLLYNDCNCRISCDFTTHTWKRTAHNTTGTCKIKMHMRPRGYHKRQVRFGWLDLAVSFGGVMSSFFGYSILTSVELFYYFTLRTYCGTVVGTSKPRRIVSVKTVAKKDPPGFKDFRYFDYCD